MDILKIYNKIEKIFNKLNGSELYKNGFKDCLILFDVAFKKEKTSYNLHIENTKLRKRILDLEMDLDEKDYEICNLKSEFKVNVKQGINLNDSGLPIYYFSDGFSSNKYIKTSAPLKLVEDTYREVLVALKTNSINGTSKINLEKKSFKIIRDKLVNSGHIVEHLNI